MQTSTYPCDKFISCNLSNLSLFEREPEVVPRDLVPLEAYITPDFATDNDINGMALDTGRDVEISTRSASSQLISFCMLNFPTAGEKTVSSENGTRFVSWSKTQSDGLTRCNGTRCHGTRVYQTRDPKRRWRSLL